MKALVEKSIVLVLVSLFTLTVSAQRPDKKSRMTVEERASKRTEMMTKQLELTTEQQAKIGEINLKYSQQAAENKKQIKEQMRQNKANRKAQMEARNAELKEVLTPEQLEKWQAQKSEIKKGTKRGQRNNVK